MPPEGEDTYDMGLRLRTCHRPSPSRSRFTNRQNAQLYLSFRFALALPWWSVFLAVSHFQGGGIR